MGLLEELEARLLGLPKGDLEQIARETQALTPQPWLPNPGPQTEAYESEADELFYGGEAGGGKTDLLLGTALTRHARSLILRRLNNEVEGLIDRMVEIVGHEKGLKRNAPARWRFQRSVVLFGGCQHLDDRKKYQGVPKDLIGFDEVSNFLKDQYEFIIAWARSTLPGQRVRVIACGNPPTTPEGMWVVDRWAPWLDANHPNPALPGELRWFTTINDKDTEVSGPGPVVIDGVPLLDSKGKPILPKSRTFIPAELADNPDLEETGYGATLAGLPPALRSAMMEGDFGATANDDMWQVFPREWVKAAMDRWTEAGRQNPMDVLAADIAQGGADNTTLAPRHGKWFDRVKVYPGKDTPDGPTVAGLIFMELRDRAEVVIDMGGGHGGSTRDHLRQTLSPTLFLGADTAEGIRDRTGILKFLNLRAAATWGLRDALDPAHGANIALPPDRDLETELCAMRYKMASGGKVQIEEKAEIRLRIGRSPDRADAIIMAHHARGSTSAARFGNAHNNPRAITSGRNPNRRR